MTPTVLQYFGAALALMIGLNGLFRPVEMGKAVGLSAFSKVGLVELRVLFGSLLVALPLYAFWNNSSEYFEVLGVAALAAAVIKTGFTFIDNCPLSKIWLGILVDVVLAFCLLSSVIFKI